MFLLNLTRVTRFALQNFYRNIWLSLVTITIIVLTLFSLTALIILNAAASQAIISIKDKIDISLYFKSTTPANEIDQVRSTLEKYTLVKEVKLISADQALEKFKQLHANDALVNEALTELGENPLGPTLTVKAQDVNLYPQILNQIKLDKIDKQVQEIDYDDHKTVIQKLEDISNKIKKAGLIVSALFALISLLVVFNTIRIGIYTHRNEIGVMKLVGASNWFIRMPFLLESVLYAFLGCLVFWILFYLLMGIIQPILYKFFVDIDFNLMSYLSSHLLYIFGFELILVIVLNIISSFIAMGRHLRV